MKTEETSREQDFRSPLLSPQIFHLFSQLPFTNYQLPIALLTPDDLM